MKTVCDDTVPIGELAQVNPDNTALLEEFINYLYSVHWEPDEIEIYEKDIQTACVWCLEENDDLPYLQWGRKDIRSLCRWLRREKGRDQVSAKRMRRSLSVLDAYLDMPDKRINRKG